MTQRTEERDGKRFEVVELLPAMLLSALLVAASHTSNAGQATPSAPEPVEITVTTVR